MDDDELHVMQDVAGISDVVNAKPDEIIAISIHIKRKHLDDASKKILKLVSQNNWL